MRKGAEHSYVSNPIYADHFHHNAAALPTHAICSNLVANMLITRQMIDTGTRNSYSDCKILTAVILEKDWFVNGAPRRREVRFTCRSSSSVLCGNKWSVCRFFYSDAASSIAQPSSRFLSGIGAGSPTEKKRQLAVVLSPGADDVSSTKVQIFT
jgi:hypothetical protein